MPTLLALLHLLFFFPAQYVPVPFNKGSGGYSPNTWSGTPGFYSDSGCTVPASSCSVTFTTAAGHSYFASATTISNLTISSISGGGTWSLCPASGCHVYSSGTGNEDMAYNPSSSSGSTTITVNLSGSESTYIGINIIDIGTGSGGSPVALDAYGVSSPNSANPAGVTLSLSGTRDAIVQVNASVATSGACTWTFVGGSGSNICYKVNTSSGAAPTWTSTGGQQLNAAIALK